MNQTTNKHIEPCAVNIEVKDFTKSAMESRPSQQAVKWEVTRISLITVNWGELN